MRNQEKKHCFIESKRPCSLKCMAAYEDDEGLCCTFIWASTEVGWANFEQSAQAYKKFHKNNK